MGPGGRCTAGGLRRSYTRAPHRLLRGPLPVVLSSPPLLREEMVFLHGSAVRRGGLWCC